MGGYRHDGATEGRNTKDRARYVSTGHLPSPRQVQGALDEAYRLYRSETSGETSQTYPALARVPGHLFGICVARGQLVARHLSRTLGLSLFASRTPRASHAVTDQRAPRWTTQP